jgi:glycine/D-amino acid oxidase-like deaminating enzyme
MSAQKRVVVVGAGIVGLSCAYFLRLRDCLGRWLRTAGVEFREGVKLVGFDTADRRVRAARTSEGELSGDAFVLAAGAWTQPLARKLAVSFPMQQRRRQLDPFRLDRLRPYLGRSRTP